MKTDRLELILYMLQQEPEDPFLSYAASLEYLKLGDTQKAIDSLHQLRQDHPTYLPLYYQLGKILEQRHMFEEASNIYAEGIALAERHGDLKTKQELKELLLLLSA